MLATHLWAMAYLHVVHLAELMAFNALPFVIWALLSREIPWRAKLSCLLVFGVLILCCAAQNSFYLALLGGAAAAMTYYLLLALVVYRVPALLRSGSLDAGTLFAGLAVAFVFVPGVAVPGLAGLTFLAVGWDLMLSAYSYCVDTSRSRGDVPLKECLFFLLVNPVLVFSARGVRVGAPALCARSVGRVLLGILAMLAAFAVQSLPTLSFSGLGSGGRLLAVLQGGLLNFASVFFAHSGLASMKIGAMRWLGHDIPERYHYPFLAKSPLDFWRRWNTYVAVWCRRYLFFPLASAWARRHPSSLGVGKVVAVLVTFLTMGLLHDYYDWAHQHQLSWDGLALFSIAAGVVLLWAAAARVVRRKAAILVHSWKTILAGNLSRACFLFVLLLVLSRFPA